MSAVLNYWRQLGENSLRGTGYWQWTYRPRSGSINRELNRLGADIDFIFSGRNPADYFALDDFPKHALYQGLRLATQRAKWI